MQEASTEVWSVKIRCSFNVSDLRVCNTAGYELMSCVSCVVFTDNFGRCTCIVDLAELLEIRVCSFARLAF